MDPEIVTKLGGRYRFERTIGEGGMGSIYECTDTKLGRRVAIKTIQPSVTPGFQQVERFQLEAQTTARLQHTHIVQVLDIGLDNPPYIILEALSGTDLYARIRANGKMSIPRAVMIATQVLSALAAAHEAGVVHRDIKPSNIFLVETPPPGECAKVLDFGVARIIHHERMTIAGDAIGTMQYMSPEQHQGDAVDGRSDLFSLGIVLYEMLAGHRPFLTAGVKRETALKSLLTGAPIPPIPECPAELHAIVCKALALHPSRRFTSAQEMAHALTSFLPRVTQVAAQPDGPAKPARTEATVREGSASPTGQPVGARAPGRQPSLPPQSLPPLSQSPQSSQSPPNSYTDTQRAAPTQLNTRRVRFADQPSKKDGTLNTFAGCLVLFAFLGMMGMCSMTCLLSGSSESTDGGASKQPASAATVTPQSTSTYTIETRSPTEDDTRTRTVPTAKSSTGQGFR